MEDSSIQNLKMKIMVAGLGYVGVTTAALFAQSGHYVVGNDVKQPKVDAINQGQVAMLYEEGLVEIVRKQRSQRRLKATMDIKEAIDDTSIGFICVGTPSKRDGRMDFKYLQRVCRDIGLSIRDKKNYTVVVRSTMFPGSLDKMREILEDASGKKDGEGFDLVTNPEFLREGSAIKDFYNPSYVVVGAKPKSKGANKVLKCYNEVDANKFVVDPEVAQMIKYANNAWHATKVTFANEIGAISKACGVDGKAVMELFCRDGRLNLSPYYLMPGFAYGGSCLSKDTDALTREAGRLGVATPLLNAVPKSNDAQVVRAIKTIGATGKKKLGFLGLSFKQGTDDQRANRVLDLIRHFEKKRGYEVTTWDNHDDEFPIEDVLNQEVIIISSRDKELVRIAKERAKGEIINLQDG